MNRALRRSQQTAHMGKLISVAAKRLFHKNMFSCGNGRDYLLIMIGIERSDRDDVDRIVMQHFVERVAHVASWYLRRQCFGSRTIEICDTHHPAIRQRCEGARMLLANAKADDAYAERTECAHQASVVANEAKRPASPQELSASAATRGRSSGSSIVMAGAPESKDMTRRSLKPRDGS